MSDLEAGTLVEFRFQGDSTGDSLQARRLGVFDRPEGKKKLIIIDAVGQSHSLHPRQISFEVPGKRYQAEDIPGFLQDVESYLDPSSLEVAWELLSEDGESTDPESLALLLFSQKSPVFCYVSYRLLSEDKLYFKQKGDRYEPRTQAQVDDLKHQRQRQAERQQQQIEFHEHLAQGIVGELVDWTASDRLYLGHVEQFALLGEDCNAKAQALEILKAVQFDPNPDGAFKLMVSLKLWDIHENLALRRNNTPIQFPGNVLLALENCLTMPPPDPDSDRRDLTHLKVYTIDDEGTAEIDDGLSLERLEEGREKIWIHIADPSRWVMPGDALDQEAQKRTTTVYLPTGMIPMFPKELSTGPMSLTQGNICCALSFGVLLTEEAAIESYEICVSQIKPTYRLTYEDVDEMLELGVQAESELIAIAKWAKLRKKWRNAQGAISIQLPESSIKVEGDQIRIEVLPDSISRNLVAEMMILTGQVAAHFGHANGVPLPFRHQPQPELPSQEELLQLAPGPVRGSALRRCMPRSEVGTTPLRHSSLGLDSYCQVTSPIRRYADLLAHFQIKAHLRGGELPFNQAELMQLINSVTSIAYEATLLERQTNRYWSLEFLRQNMGEIWQALVLRWLREHENLALVLLEDLGIELPMRIQRTVQLGDSLNVVVNEVNPRMDRIFLTEYAESTAM